MTYIFLFLYRVNNDRRIKGRDTDPLLSYDPDIQKEAAKAVLNGMD